MSQGAGAVIVGASVAALTVAEGLRGEGYTGPITLVGAEDHLPYSRPPLSKQILSGSWQVAQAALCRSEALDGLGVRFLRGRRATAADLDARTLRVDGMTLRFEHLIAATGATARPLSNPRRLRGIRSLRTLEDATALRHDLSRLRRLVVVGGGVLGCEIAATASSAGHEVTVVGRSLAPRFAQAGGHLSGRIAGLLRDHGVHLRMGVEVVEPIGVEAVSSLVLSDGSVVDADVVVAAIGTIPVVDWLDGTGIDLTDGVLCDAHGAAADGVYAVGDVARWRDPLTGEARRIEHQATAIEQAHAVARLIVTGESAAPIASFFWSELFGRRILVHGHLDADAPLTTLAGDTAGAGFVAATIRDGRTTGIVGWNMPREFRRERARLCELATAVHTEDLSGVPVT